MKIALINNHFSPSHGGLERFGCNLARMLVQNGHQVHLFAQSFSGVPKDVFTHMVKVPKKPAFLRIWVFSRKVAAILRNEDFDIVYGLTRVFPLDIYRMGDGVQRHWLTLRYPNVIWRYLNCFFNFSHLVNLYLEKKVFSQESSRMWVANSHLCRNQAIEYLKVDPDRVSVIYNGVDHSQFNPDLARRKRESVRSSLGLTEHNIAIVYVANNWRRKGLDVLLRAVGRLGPRGRNLHVYVIGRGSPKAFRNIVKEQGLSGRVHFIGPTKQVVDCYGSGDLLVLPTQYDPFSNVCLEAMACGLPVITTSENGASEVVEPGQSGYIQTNPHSDTELAKILDLCLDHKKVALMGVAAAEACQGFTLERNLNETVKLFKRVIDEKKMAHNENS